MGHVDFTPELLALRSDGQTLDGHFLLFFRQTLPFEARNCFFSDS